MRLILPIFVSMFVIFVAGTARADRLAVVIDTDAGLDDAVALAIALQQPRLDIRAIVVTEGVASGERGLDFVDRLLTFSGRQDIPLYGPARRLKKQPSFRAGAEATLHRVLPTKKGTRRRRFSASAYCRGCTLLALGPLTSFAGAIAVEPAAAARVERVIFRGTMAPPSWNVRFDPDAVEVVRVAKTPVSFLQDTASTRKSARWLDVLLADRKSRAPALQLLRRILAGRTVRRHYLETLAHFTDEVGLLVLLAPGAVRQLHTPRRWRFGQRSRLVVGRAHQSVLRQLTRLTTLRRWGNKD